MESISWLLEFAYSHEKLKLAQDENSDKHHKIDEYHEEVSRLSERIPQDLESLSFPAIRTLSNFMKKKMSGDNKILGHEIISSLHVEAGQSLEYLQALDELEFVGFLELIPDTDSQMKQRPWCWLQARIEMGQQLVSAQGSGNAPAKGFESNEEYIDAVVEYINQLAQRLTSQNQTLCNEEIHQLPQWRADQKFNDIEARVALTKIPIPAAEIRTTHKLSGWQYLFLIGMMGRSELSVKYDFSDLNDVVKLFASGFNVRRMMREHLIGSESPLIKHALIENKDGFMFCGTKPTEKAIRLLTASKITPKSIEEIKKYVIKETIFDFERPKMKHDALMLPAETMENIRAIIHAEKPAGRKLRAELEKNFPSEIGSPSGSTILLYGPPGTGKTLTASYLASELNVPILKVDCSKVLGKYVGEDEKNTKRIFDDYKTMCKMLNKKPVLLMNEADQLLGQRLTPRGSAEQAHNNMQNLFLEALERFDGILVATTNRKELLDEAYSRRFTYKLELLPPDATTRRKLWESHLPKNMISGQIDMGKLASYQLTGGEIRLVLEQAVRKAAVNGCTRLEGSMLMEIAGKEAVASNGKQMRSIGFIVA